MSIASTTGKSSIPCMSATTDAIVLSLQPHSDKAFVVHAYTRAGGRINYMVYGLGRKHAIGMYTPLSLIQITADYSPSKLPAIKEASPLNNNQSLLTPNIYKQTISLFIAEVLYHVLRHPMVDEPMFDFLVESIKALNQTGQPQNFHLQFLVDFAAKLGFAMPESPTPLTSNPLTRAERQRTLKALCDYFSEHVETWETPKSLDVLIEVFD